jgi:putative oxidoreductase
MQEDLGKLVVRLSTGGLLLLHGVHKLLNGIAPIKAMLAAHNAPEVLGYGVYLGEIVGPILVILGLFSRVGGALIAFSMIMAILLAGTDALLALNAQGGYALELESFYLLGAITVILMGAGRFGFNIGGRWN